MLAEFRLEDFKSYRQAVLPLVPLTLLIGANASGKSNLIEALRLLSWLAQDHKLGPIRYELRDTGDVVRGTIADLARRGRDGFSFGCRVDLDTREGPHTHRDLAAAFGWEQFSLHLGVRDDGIRITNERIWSSRASMPLYEVRQPATPPSHDTRVAYNNFARGGTKPQIIPPTG